MHWQTVYRNTIHVSGDSVIGSFNMEIPLTDAFQVTTSWVRHWGELLSRRCAEYASLCVCAGDRVVFFIWDTVGPRLAYGCWKVWVCVAVILVCRWCLGANKICVVFGAGSETTAWVGVRCTDSWQTAVFPVILRSPLKLWPVMRLLRKILFLLAACLNLSSRYQTNALEIPLDGK